MDRATVRIEIKTARLRGQPSWLSRRARSKDKMITPSLILAVLVGSMIGLAFFYAFGRKSDNMFICWLVSVGAFLAGQLLGVVRPVAPVLLGEVHILEGSVASLLALAIMHFAKR